MKGTLRLFVSIVCLLHLFSFSSSIDASPSKHLHVRLRQQHNHDHGNTKIIQAHSEHTIYKHNTHNVEVKEGFDLSVEDQSMGNSHKEGDDSVPHSISTSLQSNGNVTDTVVKKYTVSYVMDAMDDGGVGPSIVSVLKILIGVALCMAGFRLFEPTVYLFGFIIGGRLLAAVAENVIDDSTWVVVASWICFIIGGCLLGLFLISWILVGIFVIGGIAGICIAMFIYFGIYSILGIDINPDNPDGVITLLVIVLGLGGAILALSCTPIILVFATSLVGAQFVVLGFAYFIGDYPTLSAFEEYRENGTGGKWISDIPSLWWVYLAATILLLVCGILVQFRVTGKDKKLNEEQEDN